jgi:large subunit ribosomal protein L18
MKLSSRADSRLRRKQRVRRRLRGTSERPRLTVFRSAKHIYAQIIDDGTARTLAEASTISKDIGPQVQGKAGNRDGATLIGSFLAKRALEKGIKRVVFDRNGFLYHGRVKALAEAARQAGLEF